MDVHGGGSRRLVRLLFRGHAAAEAEAQARAFHASRTAIPAKLVAISDAWSAGPNRARWGAAETRKPVLHRVVRGTVRGATPKSRWAGVPWVYEIP